jgi:hypothetical protein
MTSEAAELDPAEQRRRAVAIAKAVRLVRRLGFRPVIARTGWWYHEDLGQERSFALTVAHNPVETVGDVLCNVFDHGAAHGRAHVQNLILQAAGLKQ